MQQCKCVSLSKDAAVGSIAAEKGQTDKVCQLLRNRVLLNPRNKVSFLIMCVLVLTMSVRMD